MADDPLNPNQPPPAADPNSPPDGQGKKPEDQPQGADTPPAKPLEAKKDDDQPKVDITQSSEFKDALTKAIRDKIPQLQKQARKDVTKELSGEKEGEPTVEDLKGKLTGLELKVRVYEARDQLETFAADKRNQVTISNYRGVFKLIKDDLQYDDDGKVTNFKEVLASAKSEAPEFFRGQSSSIDAGNGSRQQSAMDMNAWMRGR